MVLIKLTQLDDGSIKAETPRQTIGYFEDITLQEVREYLADQATEVGESVRFVDHFEEREEPLNMKYLMKGKRKK